MSSNPILALTTAATKFLVTTLLHPIYFPFPLALVLHAARTSLAHQHLARASSGSAAAYRSAPWPAYLAGFLIFSWGGGVTANLLLGLPPPQLYSAYPWAGYLGTHLFLTAASPVLNLERIPARVMDTMLLPIDTLLRIIAIFGALNLLTPAPASLLQPHPLLLTSPIIPLILGAVASSGGGTLASALSVWSPDADWRVRTPGWLRPGVGLRGSVDVWGGAVAAGVYQVLAGEQPFYWELRQSAFALAGVEGAKDMAVQPADARAVATLVLGALFGWRVYGVHWAPAPAAKVQKEEVKEKAQ